MSTDLPAQLRWWAWSAWAACPAGRRGRGSRGQLELAHQLLWLMFACTTESAVFQGMDWAARRASLRRLVPAADLALLVAGVSSPPGPAACSAWSPPW